jgi:hydrogenase assembly chaperone HypC/HupF
MCLAIPVKIKRVDGDQIITENNKAVDTSLIGEQLKKGDYLLVHDQMAVNRLAKREAEKILQTVASCNHS